MDIVLNGEGMVIDDGFVITDLLEKLNQDSKRVVVELNQNIVGKSDYSEVQINDGDSFEIIQFVPGG